MVKYPNMKKKKTFAKKSLGQNFLNNPQIRDGILEEAGDISGTNILEIGPGLGFLTTSLLKAKANLTAIEFDERAAKLLEQDLGHKDNFRLIQGDFLDEDLDAIFEQKNYSIIANIPYNITNPILRKILEKTQNKPEFAILMVQKEVAQKICTPRKKSILSISVEVFAEPAYCFTVNRENFTPAPKVDSAIMRLDIREQPLVSKDRQKDFFTVVNAGFNEKRKKLGNHLGKFFGVPAEKLLGDIDPNRRAETLSVEEWIHVAQNFQNLNLQPH